MHGGTDMTTIVADKNSMACDSMAIDSSIKTRVQKVWKIKGWLIGVAGTYSDLVQVIHDIKKSGETPMEYLRDRNVKVKESAFLLLSPSGKVYISEDGGTPLILNEGFGAIGTGTQGAMVALYQGLSAGDAVRAVKKVDPNTGGRVITRNI